MCEDVSATAMSQLISDRQFLKVRIFCLLYFLFSLFSVKVPSLNFAHFILSPVCVYLNLFYRHKSPWFSLFSGLSCPVSVFRPPSPLSIGPPHSCKKAPLQINVWITCSPSPRSDSWCIMYDTYGSTRSVLSVSRALRTPGERCADSSTDGNFSKFTSGPYWSASLK